MHSYRARGRSKSSRSRQPGVVLDDDYAWNGSVYRSLSQVAKAGRSYPPGNRSVRFSRRRNTAFAYKGKPLDVKTIGRELNVRYVLEGSVQRGGNRMRVNVQLIDAETGNHLWAERFDKPLADLFDMQDEIVARLARALNAQFIAAEARRAEQAPNPDSMDLYFQGLARLNTGCRRRPRRARRDR